MRNTPVFEQPDNAGHTDALARGMELPHRVFLRRSDALEHQHERTAGRAHVDRLIARVQYQYRTMQSVMVVDNHRRCSSTAISFGATRSGIRRSVRAKANKVT